MSGLKNKRVFVGMSGGVDSSVAAMLLKNQGYDVTGVYLKCYVRPDGSCMKDAMDAMAVAKVLGIPCEIWDFCEEYKRRVIDYMIDGYRRGLTPNPDVECNREIKFGLFLERTLKLGANYVATGHYVRLRSGRFSSFALTPTSDSPDAFPAAASGRFAPAEKATRLRGYPPRLRRGLRSRGLRPRGFGGQVGSHSENLPDQSVFSLYAARDSNKDQSYFLWTLKQEQLRHALFPIGDYLKSEVREMARQAGLPTADKKDSQGICFLGPVTLDEFLKQYLPERQGEVLSVSGERLGEHNGAHFYTIGQREGIGNVKHQKGVRLHKPLYVVSKDVQTNVVTVAEGGDENLSRNEAELIGVNFIGSKHSNIILNVGMLEVWARVRYRQPLMKGTLLFSNSRELENSDGNSRAHARLVFDQPQRFVAPGQSAVFYTKDGELIGGGIIIQKQ